MRRPVILAWAFLVIPIAGWILAQSIPARPAESSTSAGLWWHMIVTSLFAILLLLGAAIVALVVTGRAQDRPRSYEKAYPRAQWVVIALGLGWLGCILLGDIGTPFELVLAPALVVASIVAFVFAVRGDAESRERKAARIEARTPGTKRALRIAAIAVPVGVLAVLGVTLAVQQLTVVKHTACEVANNSVNESTVSLLTTNCGDFTLAADAIAPDELRDDDADVSGTYDITSRGFTFGFGAEAIAIEVVRVGG